MADPTVSIVTQGAGSTAATSHPISFTAQPAGTLLLLMVTAEAYPTGDPAGWTRAQWINSTQWMGIGLWYRVATGAETSVTVAISAAGRAAWTLAAADNIDTSNPLDTSAVANSATNPGGTNTYTGPTITPAAGRRLAIATMHRISDVTTTGLTSPTGSYTQQAVASATAGDRPAVVLLTRVMDGGTSTGTGGTWAPTTGGNYQFAGIVASFRVAAGGTPGTMTATAGAATASGGTTSLTGAATLTAAAASATAAGGSASMQGAGRFAVTAGSASGGGGSVTLTGQGVLTASAGTATATGGTVVMSAGSPATMVALPGAATTAGGTATLTGAATLTVTTGASTAGGGQASMTTGTPGIITALTGAATASGGAVTITGAARLTASAGQAHAGGGLAQMVGDDIEPVPTPASRTLTVAREPRTLAIPRELRTLTVAHEDRTLRVRSA